MSENLLTVGVDPSQSADQLCLRNPAGKISEGMDKTAAFGVVMTKMVRWVYGIWNSREPWRKMTEEKRKPFEKKNARMLVKLGVELLFWKELAREIQKELKKESEPKPDSEEESDT